MLGKGGGPTPTPTPEDGEKCAICKKQQHDARVYRWKLIAGLVLPDLLSSLDLTIVATATPFISSHFSKSLPPLRALLGRKLTR